eukprot:1967316-Pyramimonas_sp.AAC.1
MTPRTGRPGSMRWWDRAARARRKLSPRAGRHGWLGWWACAGWAGWRPPKVGRSGSVGWWVCAGWVCAVPEDRGTEGRLSQRHDARGTVGNFCAACRGGGPATRCALRARIACRSPLRGGRLGAARD